MDKRFGLNKNEYIA